MLKPTTALAFASYDEIFMTEAAREDANLERIVEISLDELFTFEDHPFQVRDDDAMRRLAESVEKHGVRYPAIVRPRSEGGYEIVAGHRRKRACEIAGRSTIPAIIRDLDDDDAVLTMVDTNLEQRESLLFSEKAWAYRMKLEALNHRGVRTDETGRLSVDIVAEQTGESKNQIFRYIRLTELVPGLLDMVDSKKIAFNPAVELSHLTRKEQAELLDTMAKCEATPSLSQAQRMKKHSQAGELTRQMLESILSEPKKEPVKVTLAGTSLKQYFPPTYTPKQMESVIMGLLESWHKKQAAIN